jgi:hypothetical protein
MARRLLTPFIAVLLSVILLGLNDCSKQKTPTVSFSTTQVNLTNPDNVSVTVQLSQPVNELVEIWFDGIGRDTISFGSFNNRFLNDDSNRIYGSLSAQVTIDSPVVSGQGHISLGYGTSSFTITLNSLYDNFAKPAAEYKLRLKSAKNANISSSNNVLTIDVAGTSMTPVFASSLADGSTLTSYSYAPATTGSGYALALNYSSGYTATFSHFVPQVGPGVVSTSDDGASKLTTNFELAYPASSTRGNYYEIVSGGSFSRNGSINGPFTCAFIVF